MKRGRGGDSTEAIKEVWMQGYREGLRRAGGVPVVKIDPADIARVYEPGTCAHPDECPCSSSERRESRERE